MVQVGSDQLAIDLEEGGSLGFAGFGDPGGVPCLAFHGMSSSRLMPGWMFPQEALCRLSGTMVLRSARGDPQRFVQGLSRRLPEADRQTTLRVLAHPGARPAMIADLRESYRQGTTAMAADLLMYTRPWGFRLDEVTTTAHLWHGEHDPKVPITVARELATSLPHCQPHFASGGHLMACDHTSEILRTLTSAF